MFVRFIIIILFIFVVDMVKKKANVASKKSVYAHSILFSTIIDAIAAKKGENIISINLQQVPGAIVDFFIICEANNTIQLRSIYDYVIEQAKGICKETPYQSHIKNMSQWLTIDFIHIVVHIMHPQARHYYQIEELWSDASIEKYFSSSLQ